MRLRRKPWIDEAILEFDDFVYATQAQIESIEKGAWGKVFSRSAPLHVELGTGKGRFISQTAALHPEIDFIGIEAQQDVIYFAARKVREQGLKNVKFLKFDINCIEEIFAESEVDRFYINFCDPWPKKRHAKRRLTHVNFLEKYRRLLGPAGQIFFKTDNRTLFDFSLEQFKEADLNVEKLTFDLHSSGMEGNIMTEYEAKFSAMGEKINRCELSFKS